MRCDLLLCASYAILWEAIWTFQVWRTSKWSCTREDEKFYVCVPITAQYSVTWYLKYVISGKIKISVWVESKLEAWEVNWARSVLSNELEHSRNLNCEYRKVTGRVVTPISTVLRAATGDCDPIYGGCVGVAYRISPYSTVITAGFLP